MACGTIGPGRLSEPERIVSAALEILGQSSAPSTAAKDLTGESILITAGATREPIDPVRFIPNRSSGRMGFALAEAARDRGAHVTVVAGVTSVDAPEGVRVVEVTSAEEMRGAVANEKDTVTVFIAAAAVADYRAKQESAIKIKKSAKELSLQLERTSDILDEVGRSRRNGQLVVGFAAETDNVLANAREKLTRKNLDAIVANDVSRSESGFDSERNTIAILLRDDPQPIELPLLPKLEAAHRILDEVVKLRRVNPSVKTVASEVR